MLGVLPLLAVAALAAWQLVLVGHSAWLAADAARVAARARVVGRDPVRAARSAVPAAMERGLEVERTDGGGTSVRVPVPLVTARGEVKLGASASLEVAR